MLPCRRTNEKQLNIELLSIWKARLSFAIYAPPTKETHWDAPETPRKSVFAWKILFCFRDMAVWSWNCCSTKFYIVRFRFYSSALYLSWSSKGLTAVPSNLCLETAETTKSFEYGKCLETGETAKSLQNNDFSGDFVVFLFLDTFEYGKCLELREFSFFVTHTQLLLYIIIYKWSSSLSSSYIKYIRKE